MTGFGVVSKETELYTFTAEVRSLNSKSQDFSIRLPRFLQEKELEIRQWMSQILDRGKANIHVEFEKKTANQTKVQINEELFHLYYQQIKSVAQSVNDLQSDFIKLTLSMPEVVSSQAKEIYTEQDTLAALQCIEEALAACDAFRIKEGSVLAEKLLNYIHQIESRLHLISQLDPTRLQKIQDRIKTKLTEALQQEFDGNRFEQEMIYFIEKLDITEEKVRLQTHLDLFKETMNAPLSGKKLGFIAQEIGREINTIGSKANDAEIQKYVVEMKDELEKIKEQSLNVL